MQDQQPDLMLLEEVAELVRKTPQALYTMRYKGTGPPSFRLGRRVVYRRAAVLAWVKEQEAATRQRPHRRAR
jgi:predicted DNA-binding transcriptional regulator AlpA